MAKLTQAGLVESKRGKSGGVQLTRCPDQITLKEVYLASQGRPLLDRVEKEPEAECPVSCAMGKIIDELFEGIETSVESHLSKIKLAELVGQVQKGKVS